MEYALTQVAHETLALDTDVYLLLRPKTVPVNAPGRMPSEALRPFLNQEKDLLRIGGIIVVLFPVSPSCIMF